MHAAATAAAAATNTADAFSRSPSCCARPMELDGRPWAFIGRQIAPRHHCRPPPLLLLTHLRLPKTTRICAAQATTSTARARRAAAVLVAPANEDLFVGAVGDDGNNSAAVPTATARNLCRAQHRQLAQLAQAAGALQLGHHVPEQVGQQLTLPRQLLLPRCERGSQLQQLLQQLLLLFRRHDDGAPAHQTCRFTPSRSALMPAAAHQQRPSFEAAAYAGAASSAARRRRCC
jgi:hypothetical protein